MERILHFQTVVESAQTDSLVNFVLYLLNISSYEGNYCNSKFLNI